MKQRRRIGWANIYITESVQAVQMRAYERVKHEWVMTHQPEQIHKHLYCYDLHLYTFPVPVIFAPLE